MRCFRVVSARLALFSLYIPSFIGFPILTIYKACTTSPPRSFLQWIADSIIVVGLITCVLKILQMLYRTINGKYPILQSKKIINVVSVLSLCFIGILLIVAIGSDSWWIWEVSIYFIYSLYIVLGIYKNHLVPEGFIKNRSRKK